MRDVLAFCNFEGNRRAVKERFMEPIAFCLRQDEAGTPVQDIIRKLWEFRANEALESKEQNQTSFTADLDWTNRSCERHRERPPFNALSKSGLRRTAHATDA